MSYPKDLKYTREHEWIRVEGSTATVGITYFAQKELGDIVFVDINSVGETIEQNATFGTIEAVKTVSDLFMPVTATVTEFNSAVQDTAELVNKDPYGKGWLIKIDISDASQLDSLLSAEEYEKLVH